MRLAERHAALLRWDREIVEEYLSRVEGGEQAPLRACSVKLQHGCARDLVLVSADVAVRAADQLGSALATLDNTALRDAALSVAVARYVAVLPSPNRHGGDQTLAERILAGLVLRFDAAHGQGDAPLVPLTVNLPTARHEALTNEVARVLDNTDLTDLGDYRAALEADVWSSLIEAIALEWMNQRAELLSIRLGRTPVVHGSPTPARRHHRRREPPH